eukprot:CAMPEP_0118642692 /NCGR_PEP_ID=MMETSP0785-20121206/5969_1 /TAXON_ID=91992 /ORGANISM="Bolidomonas pacifica, Strain CCMP 1866" /LENGTH=578 /DNA_ID=CAMNT_0006534257 /DNA_START=137 /DNA_END=1870 /DNA_ORIENTATION=-
MIAVRNMMFLLSFIKLAFALPLPSPPITDASPSPSSPIPVTLVSGFLGAGKSTLLSKMLNNDKSLKIGVVVNDMAEVNVDSKLIKQETFESDDHTVVELENGCACCDASDELLTSISRLVTLSDLRNQADDHPPFSDIVIEASGISDPKGIRRTFQDAQMYGMPLMDRVRLRTLVTVVDTTTFLDHIARSGMVNAEDSPDLFFRSDEERKRRTDADREWAEALSPELREALNLDMNNFFQNSESSHSSVSQLCISQVEISDVILLNKVDLQDSERINLIEKVVTALNPRAKILKCSRGDVDVVMLLRSLKEGAGVADCGVVDDHKDFVSAALQDESAEVHDCEGSDCDHPSHDHKSHDHTESHDHEDSHDHSHSHSNSNTHSHSHSHDHSACDDPDCTDPSHSHSHSRSNTHSHGNIGSFVFRSRRPFHPDRLNDFIKTKLNKGTSKLLRAKGFCWMAHSHSAALYFAFAGVTFEMQCLGRWWACLPSDTWPADAMDAILADFDSEGKVGDRRNEIVFIGDNFSNNDDPARADIEKNLASCLLNKEEMQEYTDCLVKGYGEEVEAQIDTKVSKIFALP